MTLRERLGNVWGCFDWGQAWFELWYRPPDLPRKAHSEAEIEFFDNVLESLQTTTLTGGPRAVVFKKPVPYTPALDPNPSTQYGEHLEKGDVTSRTKPEA